jgi:hypothetical protein
MIVKGKEEPYLLSTLIKVFDYLTFGENCEEFSLFQCGREVKCLQ